MHFVQHGLCIGGPVHEDLGGKLEDAFQAAFKTLEADAFMGEGTLKFNAESSLSSLSCSETVAIQLNSPVSSNLFQAGLTFVLSRSL